MRRGNWGKVCGVVAALVVTIPTTSGATGTRAGDSGDSRTSLRSAAGSHPSSTRATTPRSSPTLLADPLVGRKGRAPENHPTAAERKLAAALAGNPLQAAAQPAQTIIAQAAATTAAPARVVRLTDNGAWTWFTDPRVLETAQQTYLGYVTRGGTVQLSAIRHSDARMTTTSLRKFQLEDDHNVPALLQMPDGRIAAFWAGHGKAPVRYRVSTKPDDITTMGPTRYLKGSGLESTMATYVQAFRLRGVTNQYHVLTRRITDSNWVLVTSRDLVNWSKPVQLLKHSKFDVPTWPYLEAFSTGWRTIHLAVTDGQPGKDVDSSLFHLTYRATDKTLHRSDGSLVQRPADPRWGTKIYDGRSVDGKVRVYDIALRSDGQPAIAFTTIDHGVDPRSYTYKWARLSSGRWKVVTIARQQSYPEGISTDSADADRILLVTRDGGSTQVSELTTADGGAEWVARPISARPETQRTPTTAFGASQRFSALWMRGPYPSFRDYETGLLGETTGPAPVAIPSSWPTTWDEGAGVSATVRAGAGGPGVPGLRVNLLVRKPGQAQSVVTHRTTDESGAVHFTVNTSYPAGTMVRLGVPATTEWGSALTKAHYTD